MKNTLCKNLLQVHKHLAYYTDISCMYCREKQHFQTNKQKNPQKGEIVGDKETDLTVVILHDNLRCITPPVTAFSKLELLENHGPRDIESYVVGYISSRSVIR